MQNQEKLCYKLNPSGTRASICLMEVFELLIRHNYLFITDKRKVCVVTQVTLCERTLVRRPQCQSFSNALEIF